MIYDWLDVKGTFTANRQYLKHKITPRPEGFILQTSMRNGDITEQVPFDTFDEAEAWSRVLDAMCEIKELTSSNN